MGKVLQADFTLGDADARLTTLDLAAGFWLEAWVYVPQATLDDNVVEGGTPPVLYFGDGITAVWTGSQWTWSTIKYGGYSGLVDAGWHFIEVHYDGVEMDWFVDADPLFAYDLDPLELDAFIAVGGYLSGDEVGVYYVDEVRVGTSEHAIDLFADDFEGGDLSLWDFTDGDVSVIDDPTGGHPADVVPPDPGPPRVYEDPLWRFVVTNLDLETVTFLDRLATNKHLEFTLNQPSMATGVVPSDNPEVTIELAGHPFVDEGRRLLMGFRREGGDPPWVCRFGGIIMQLEDAVDESSAPSGHSTLTAWDPWKYLYSRPVVHADGSLLGPDGLEFENRRANEIATLMLDRTLTYHGEHHIMTGVIEPCPEMDITFQQGTSIGEAWEQLCESGFCDIVLVPHYDPFRHPRKVVALHIAPAAGRDRDGAIFAWDNPSHELGALTRLKDGTQRANRVKEYLGQGGPGVPLESDFASIAAFGEYWLQKFQAGNVRSAVTLLAETDLLVLKGGVTTYTAKPTPELAPRPFQDYRPGDCVPVYATKRLREAVATRQRVLSIAVDVDDDGGERVADLGFSTDGSSCS